MRRLHWLFWPLVAVAGCGAAGLYFFVSYYPQLDQREHVLVGPDASRDICDYWKRLEADYTPKGMEETCR